MLRLTPGVYYSCESFLNAFINTLRLVFSLCKIILIHPKDILSMRNKIILAMAAAGMMYGASVFAADTTPTAGTFGSGKILFTGTITNSPCDIAPGDDAITVPFGQISYRKLNAADAQQLQAGNNELNFFARLIALTDAATPGDVNASVTYTLKYL
ncbi:hypothetical protein DS583_04030 [Salmonella enterica subsp. enterica serovar Napoli]|uniref:Fimbrial protein n=2 Tax=Salmonella enterica subsp. enterica serovar Napoli TaxID=1151001 RepID=A0A5U6JUF2_SALET|nr:hypothetical protein [Salmonella enterica subsp. enterica serovar Napoli]EBX1907828.1 hypothetical protein [Salmonella enterica subsp. enterica serovar Zaiman]EAA4527246.1 hypothetical protein [Salmonella enterica subsp. enterica serovar Napoli]EAC0582119.1 hypothetical protein [Salmonella enterica subsp. enterica serovar Napoli]EBQ8895279.1 hypothetical protein [Salmonella enterica subsp. enterica serovar Napoli]